MATWPGLQALLSGAGVDGPVFAPYVHSLLEETLAKPPLLGEATGPHRVPDWLEPVAHLLRDLGLGEDEVHSVLGPLQAYLEQNRLDPGCLCTPSPRASPEAEATPQGLSAEAEAFVPGRVDVAWSQPQALPGSPEDPGPWPGAPGEHQGLELGFVSQRRGAQDEFQRQV